MTKPKSPKKPEGTAQAENPALTPSSSQKPAVARKALGTTRKSSSPMVNATAEIMVSGEALSTALDEAKKEGAASLVRLYSRARTELDMVADALKRTSQLIELMNRVVIPEAFENEKISTLTEAESGDRVTITQRVVASIPADQREAAYAWLRANDHESMITETVNASSLSAFAKALMEEGQDLPDDIFKTTILAQTSLTRGRRGKA